MNTKGNGIKHTPRRPPKGKEQAYVASSALTGINGKLGANSSSLVRKFAKSPSSLNSTQKKNAKLSDVPQAITSWITEGERPSSKDLSAEDVRDARYQIFEVIEKFKRGEITLQQAKQYNALYTVGLRSIRAELDVERFVNDGK